MNTISNFFDFFKNDFFKNILLIGCATTTFFCLYINNKKSKEINFLNTELNNLYKENSDLKVRQKLLSDELIELKKNNFNYDEILLLNTDNWNYLFDTSIYDIYKKSLIYGDYVVFSLEEFYNIVNLSSSSFIILEYNLKNLILKNIYNLKVGEILINPVNCDQINYEIYNCFRKLRVLNEDRVMNDLLCKYHNNTHPFYVKGQSCLKNILLEQKKLPFSYDTNYIKKYSNFAGSKNLHPSVFQISKFQ